MLDQGTSFEEYTCSATYRAKCKLFAKMSKSVMKNLKKLKNVPESILNINQKFESKSLIKERVTEGKHVAPPIGRVVKRP